MQSPSLINKVLFKCLIQLKKILQALRGIKLMLHKEPKNR
jgi:hypothetical protein